jgi:glycosyltransferase involved in cell wall biosynthesis
VDLEEFRPKESFNAGRDLTFLFSGRLVREKGVLEYIEAAAILKRKYPAARFIILGLPADNPHAVDVELIRKAEKAGHIEFPGHTDRMAEYLDNVDVVVLPSWYREGIPRVLIEALAKGLPVITTDFTGCRETVEHEVNGLLIPPNDLDALIKAMESMINMDPEARQAMGKAGRAMAEKKFDVKDVVDRYLELAEHCIK